MKVKLLRDPYLQWEGMTGKVVHAFVDSTHPVGCFASIEEANSLGATDNVLAGERHMGYRFLLDSEFEIVEEDEDEI